MRKAPFKLCAAACACALVCGITGCASTGSTSSSTDNSVLYGHGMRVDSNQEFATVEFGTYEQDGNTANGAEAIEWYVLDEQDGKALLISKDVLDAVPYSTVDTDYEWSIQSPRPTTDVDWESSNLREFLNQDFFNTAFSADEQAKIVETLNTDSKNNVASDGATGADSSIHVATDTSDNVFVLSRIEAMTLFNDDYARVAYPTQYALSQGVYTGVSTDENGQIDESVTGSASWWLRSTGYYAGYEAVVTDDGYVYGDGYRANGETYDGFDDHGQQAAVTSGNFGVRPCIWVDALVLG